MAAGKANPAPPVGPALGAKGVNIMQFCKEYNAATQDKIGTIIPVEITVYEVRKDRFSRYINGWRRIMDLSRENHLFKISKLSGNLLHVFLASLFLIYATGSQLYFHS